jgi:hypothetical protein
VAARPVERRGGDGHRLLCVGRREEVDADLVGQDAQLLDRRGAVDVGADQQELLFLLA